MSEGNKNLKKYNQKRILQFSFVSLPFVSCCCVSSLFPKIENLAGEKYNEKVEMKQAAAAMRCVTKKKKIQIFLPWCFSPSKKRNSHFVLFIETRRVSGFSF